MRSRVFGVSRSISPFYDMGVYALVDKKSLFRTYVQRVRGNDHARRQYAEVIRRYLRHVTDHCDYESVERRIAELRDQGYAAGTILWQFRQIRSFFSINGLPWPYRRGEGPRLRASDVVTLSSGDDLVARLIAAAASTRVRPVHALYVALSTTYGLRRVELAQLTADDIDLDAACPTVYVSTRKRGQERRHVIPPEILPVVETSLPHLRPVSDRAVTDAYWRVEAAAGLPHTPDLGWHGIRHALDARLLRAGLDPATVRAYLRWNAGPDMSIRYAVGLREVGVAQAGRDPDSAGPTDPDGDARVYAVHPYLPLWREAYRG